MKNLAIIIPKLNGGGAERCASNLSLELSKIYNVYLIVFDSSNITYPYGGTLIGLNIPQSYSILKRCIGVFKRCIAIRKIKQKYKIDVCISLLDGPNIVNVLSGGRSKTIVSVRNCMSKQHLVTGSKQLIRYTCKKADLAISLSEMVKIDLQEHFGVPSNKIVTVYNHVDKDMLDQQETDSEFILDTQKKYIVNIGRLHPQKGQWHLIRAFKKVATYCPDLNLLILGEGELRKSLICLAKDLEIADKVIMPGYIKAPHKLLKNCEIFVLSSLFEGLGNVLLEASAYGLPIISTDCIAGPREILNPTNILKHATTIEEGEYGILIPVDETTEIDSSAQLSNEENCLADAIIRLYNNKNLLRHYSEASLKRSRYFSKEKIISDWINVIEKI